MHLVRCKRSVFAKYKQQQDSQICKDFKKLNDSDFFQRKIQVNFFLMESFIIAGDFFSYSSQKLKLYIMRRVRF